MEERLRQLANATIGFLPETEGMALHEAALEAGRMGPLLEIGSYCGKSAVYLGAAAAAVGTVLFTVDHHRGSEEHQAGEQYHDPRLVDPESGRIDTLPSLRRTLAEAGLEQVVIPIVAESSALARYWGTALGLIFLDGSHAPASIESDYQGWADKLAPAGWLAIHDVFADPSEGGQGPFHVYRGALDSGKFVEVGAEGSLRVLRRP